MQTFLLDILEYPETSIITWAVAFTSLLFVVLSTITFMLESSFEQGIDEEEEYVFDEDLDNTIMDVFFLSSSLLNIF